MKIKEISIRGYRGITEMTLNPERINVLSENAEAVSLQFWRHLDLRWVEKLKKAISVQLTMNRMRLQLQLFLKTVLL